MKPGMKPILTCEYTYWIYDYLEASDFKKKKKKEKYKLGN